LAGVNGKRILCLANLRPQKDHENLLKAFIIVSMADSEWTLHCVGKDFKDAHSQHIFSLIDTLALHDRVFFYGSQPDTDYIIDQVDIGVLASASEGLPLALLEYGLGKLPVVATDVGDCAGVIQDEGLGQLVPKDNPEALAQSLLLYIKNDSLRHEVGHNLYTQVTTTFSEQTAIKTIMSYYQNILPN
jgi:glycosyltransferase involved in cell wall biosynthesis